MVFISSSLSAKEPTPTPLSPKGNITDSTPTYKWKAASGAKYYYLWSGDYSWEAALFKGITPLDAGCENINNTCSLNHSGELSQGKGRWYVIAWNGKWGQWSSASNYKVTAGKNDWYRPSPLTTWQWQLQGEINTSYDVEMYDIDLFDSSEALIKSLQDNNKKVICYFSGGSYENWRSDEDQFKEDDLGKTLDGWAGERWLDIRSSNVRKIMKKRLDLAKQKGCDGVEPDNMDGYTNKPGFRDPPLTFDDQINYNRFIAKEAHDRGLSIGLKNDLDQLDELVDYFDFAVNEQCFEFNECQLLEDTFIKKGKAVFNAEYKRKYIDDPSFCKDSKKMKFSTLILPLDLNDSSRHSCLEL